RPPRPARNDPAAPGPPRPPARSARTRPRRRRTRCGSLGPGKSFAGARPGRGKQYNARWAAAPGRGHLMGRTTLFVYGTLKRGGRGNRWLAGQRFLGEAVTEPTYRLYDLGTYPGLVRDEANGLAVKGELWEVDD